MCRPHTLLILLLLTITDAIAQSESGETQSTQRQVAPLTDARVMPAPFPIEIMGDLGGLEIDVEAGYTGVDAYVKLISSHDTPVRCNVLFRNGPESRQRSAQLTPQQPRMVVGGLRRKVLRLRVSLTCSQDS